MGEDEGADGRNGLHHPCFRQAHARFLPGVEQGEDGFLFLTGRKKNLIITKNGENVSPEELENKLLEQPLIREILVREAEGVIEAEVFPDEEEMKAQGLAENSITEALQKLIDGYNEQAPAYKRIYRLKVRNTEFPKTPSKKIKRY